VKKSHLLLLISPEITAEVKEQMGKEKRGGEKKFQHLQLLPHPHPPPNLQKNSTKWPRTVNWMDFPQGHTEGRKEGSNLTAFPRYLISIVLICALFEASPFLAFFLRVCSSSPVACVCSAE